MSSKRRKLTRVVAVLAIACGLLACYMFAYEPRYHGPVAPSNDPLLIAHRGFGNLAPDNSLAAVKLAIESGVDGFDLDTQLTADGELVIFHDPSVDRLTDGKGSVAEMRLKELRTLDVGVRFSKAFEGERIKTLDEVIREVDGQGLLIVELKSGGLSSEGIEQMAVDAIQKHRAHSYVYLSSFNPFVLRRLKQIDPDVRTVFIFRDVEPDDPTQFAKIPFFLKNEFCRRAIRKMIRPDLLSIETTVEKETIRNLRAKGYPIILWTPNNAADVQESLAMKPFAIITDEPIVAMSAMQQR